MFHHRRSPLDVAGASLGCAALLALSLVLVGCADDSKPPPVVSKYGPPLPVKQVPDFMRGTVWEKIDVGNTDPYQVSGYGLVVNLDNTGDSTVPFAVKEYMVKEMVKHGYGSKLNPGWETQYPERVLADKRVAIVQVVGMLPAGIRKNQSFDVVIQALPKNQTSSLAGGELYLTSLKINGADPQDPFSKINDYAQAKGFIFVNPSYALNKDVKPSTAVRQSLRSGVIMDGGVAKFDRPLMLKLRSPQSRVSRFIEQRIIDRFQDTGVAAAEDEAIIQIFVPYSFNGDWVHFTRLVTHLYLDGSPEMLAGKARILVAEAKKPNALLDDISYCWEGIGPPALPLIAPLISDPRPEVAFAAARAAAFIGDSSGAAQTALLDMARNANNPFQLNALQTLGALPSSSAINHMLRELLDSDQAIVRIEAYKVLARNHDPIITTRVVTQDPANQKFVLDVVPSHGPPIIYATRTGMPRIAIIGSDAELQTPMMFQAMDQRLTISSTEVGDTLTIYYRGAAATDAKGQYHEFAMFDPISMTSRADLAEVVQRLGGIAADDERPLNFTYSEIVAILQRLHEQKKLVSSHEGKMIQTAFVLQEPPAARQAILTAPSIGSGRPQIEDRPSRTSNDGAPRDLAAEATMAGK